MKKLLVSDYDQTFYLDDFDIEKNKKAVTKFKSKKNIFVIATGRSYYDFYNKQKKYNFNFDYAILNHGTTIINKNGKVLTNISINNDIIEDIKENDTLDFENVKIEVVKAIHGYNPLLKNGGKVFENVGYIVDDGEHRIYITSDTICFDNDYKADVVALPVTAHGLTMSSFEAALFAKELGAKLVLPIHMDNEKYPTDMEYMKKNFEKFDINYKLLKIEEEIEI